MIKYIGSKRTLVPAIVSLGRSLPAVRSVLDLFSGTSRVGHAFKRAGFRVVANDHNAYAATLARCYVQADRDAILHDAELLVREFNRLKGKPGYITDTFCVRSRYFKPGNGARIDAIREAIARKALAPELEAVMLVALMEAADRVDSTTGVQMAFLKAWAPRASNPLELRVPDVLPRARHGKGKALQLEAIEAARKAKVDLAYIDPPYNQHKYLGNYHIWETLVLWDKPEVYGTACKRLDCRTRASVFNSKPNFDAAFSAVIEAVKAPWLIVSFNNEGYLARQRAEELLSARGYVTVIEHDYKRYVGAQIGIYNPSGAKVGTVSHLRNKEFLYVVGPEKIDPQPHMDAHQLALFS
ncbi:MAG: DNA methyltransferase [Planctomycetes bacterium]|nr:DNA methyltransferase [Planctomycetota bacterium]